MKRILVLLFGLFAAGQVFAQLATITVACSGAVGNGVAIAGDATGASFVVTGISPKCSANVNLKWEQRATGFAVGSNSIKGKYIFTGNTGGGAVGPNGGICTNSICDAAQIDGPLGVAFAAAT